MTVERNSLKQLDNQFVHYKNFPNISPDVKPVYLEKGLTGYDEKWFASIGKMHLYRELIVPFKNEPKCSYEICYTREEMENNAPEEYLAIFKRPNYWCEVDFDVFGSRVLNYFGLPVVFNRRFEFMAEDGFVRNYVASISFLKQDEEFCDLFDMNGKTDKKFNIGNCLKYGLKNTLDRLGKIYEAYLKREHIVYTQELIEDFKRYMAYSLAVRVVFLNDGDFKNGNAGIVKNIRTKMVRPSANHDFGELFDEEMGKDERRFDVLGEYASLYPNDFSDFVDKTLNFVARENGKASLCEKLANTHIRELHVRQNALNMIYKNAMRISEIELQVVSGASAFGE